MQDESPSPRFPYADLDDPDVMREAAAAVASVDHLILSRISNKGIRASHPHRDDIAQKCRIHLLFHSLPKYDTSAGVKVSTFLYTCINRFVFQQVRDLNRNTKPKKLVRSFCHFSKPHEAAIRENAVAIDTTTSASVDAAIADVLQNPGKYFTAKQVELLRQLQQPDRPPLNVISKRMGLKKPSSISMMLRRMRESLLAQIDPAHFELERTGPNQIEHFPSELPQKVAA